MNHTAVSTGLQPDHTRDGRQAGPDHDRLREGPQHPCNALVCVRACVRWLLPGCLRLRVYVSEFACVCPCGLEFFLCACACARVCPRVCPRMR